MRLALTPATGAFRAHAKVAHRSVATAAHRATVLDNGLDSGLDLDALRRRDTTDDLRLSAPTTDPTSYATKFWSLHRLRRQRHDGYASTSTTLTSSRIRCPSAN